MSRTNKDRSKRRNRELWGRGGFTRYLKPIAGIGKEPFYIRWGHKRRRREDKAIIKEDMNDA